MATQSEVTYLKPKDPPKTVFIVLVPRDQPDIRSFLSLEDACRVANAAGIRTLIVPILSGVPGFHNANVALRLFVMQQDATHLFFAADDMIYPPEIIVKLVSDDRDIVAAIYRKRTISRIEPANWYPDADEFNRRLREKGVYQTEYASGHTMMIQRHVIEKMIKDYPELEYDDPHDNHLEWGLFWPMIKDRRPYMDDWAFSIRAKASGFKIWDDYSLNPAHWGGDFLTFPDVSEVIDGRRK